MISFTTAQIDAWLASLFYPLARIFALLASAPIFNNAAQPRRVRLPIALAITLAIVPALPPMPAIPPGSWAGLIVIVQQMIIGLLMGLSLRLIFAAIDVAGGIISMQMSLSFAMFYDPQNAGQSPVLSELLSIVATLLYLAMNGHLLSLSVLVESFNLLPVALNPIHDGGLVRLLAWSSILFSGGLLFALPLVTALLIANLGMGVLARVAPQLNIFAVGFPVTIMSGLVMLLFSMPYFGSVMEKFFDQAFHAQAAILRAASGM